MQIIKAGAKRRSSKKFTDKETISAKICVAFAFYKEVFFYKKFFVYKGGSSKRSQSSKRAYLPEEFRLQKGFCVLRETCSHG